MLIGMLHGMKIWMLIGMPKQCQLLTWDANWDAKWDANWDATWDANWDANQRPNQCQI